MAAYSQRSPGDRVTVHLFAASMFAAAAGLASFHLLESARRPRTPTVSDRQRAVLLDAVGSVYGTERGLLAVARARVAAVSIAVVFGAVLLSVKRTPLVLLAVVCLTAAAWQVPLILARARERRRRSEFDVELTDALGEMVMGVEAGLTLESVMRAYAHGHDSSLASEFAHVLDLVNLGIPRMDALSEFVERTPTTGVRTFVAAVQQNQKLGTPLAEVLRQQGETARRRRRQAVEEYSAKLSLKMIFPTVFCILPMLLIVIVGPAIVRLVHALP